VTVARTMLWSDGMTPFTCRVVGSYLMTVFHSLTSSEIKDPRAPQNLYPIAGLERELRRRLGNPQILHRSLRTGRPR